MLPTNVAPSSCDAHGFALRNQSAFPDITVREWANQLAIGLLARGFSICRGEAQNRITLDATTVTVDYGDISVQRALDIEQESLGLAIAVATEELVLIATDPTRPKPPPPPKPIPPRERFRLGLEANALAYARTHVGYSGGARYDLMLSERFRLGAALAFDHVRSESRAAGSVRYNSIDAQLGAHIVATRGETLALVFGVAGAPLIAFAEGNARDGFSGNTATHAAFVLRAVVDGEWHLTHHQTIALRGTIGRPLASFDARGDNGAEYGGLATWEARFGLAWLWSFY